MTAFGARRAAPPTGAAPLASAAHCRNPERPGRIGGDKFALTRGIVLRCCIRDRPGRSDIGRRASGQSRPMMRSQQGSRRGAFLFGSVVDALRLGILFSTAGRLRRPRAGLPRRGAPGDRASARGGRAAVRDRAGRSAIRPAAATATSTLARRHDARGRLPAHRRHRDVAGAQGRHPVVEKHDGQLWYVCPYEGFEANENVIYTGACPNQHLVPLFELPAAAPWRAASIWPAPTMSGAGR